MIEIIINDKRDSILKYHHYGDVYCKDHIILRVSNYIHRYLILHYKREFVFADDKYDFQYTWLMIFIRKGGRKVTVETLRMFLVRVTVAIHTEIS